MTNMENQNIIANGNTRIEYIDFLGAVSAFAVVMLHTNEAVHQFSYDGYWFSANVIECLMYFAVPVFLFISSGTLLDYRERYSTKEFFNKRFHKTLIPFLFWSLMAMAAQIVLGGGAAAKVTSIRDITPWYIIDGIINFKFLSIYNFFGYLFGMYLAIPVLSDIKDKIKIFKYMAAAGLIFNCLIPLACEFAGAEYSFITVEMCYGYTIYLPVGYLLLKTDFSKRQRIMLYISGIIGLTAHMGGMYLLSTRDGQINNMLKGYTKLPGILYSMAIFVFLRYSYPYLIKHIKKLPQILSAVSSYTFGVYLVHIYVIRGIKIVFKPDIYSLGWRVFAPFIVFPFSIAIVWIVRKLPWVGCRILPE